MIRIIGGAARGRRLQVPANGTRPTSERARAALFDRLDTLLDLAGARMLDLYAGSGAVGLEALSRRAAYACFVENDRRAARRPGRQPGRGDLARLGRRRPRTALRRPVAAVLAEDNPDEPFDIVFADPPYALARGRAGPAARPGGRAGVDGTGGGRGGRAGHPRPRRRRWPPRLESLASKRYGEGTLWYGRAT